MTACVKVGLLGLFFLSRLASVLASSSTSCDHQAGVRFRSNRFGPFHLEGKEFRVTMEDAMPRARDSQKPKQWSLATVRIEDLSGRVVWAESLGCRPARGTRVVGTAYGVAGESGVGIVIESGKIAPDRVTAGWITILGIKNGTLTVIAPDVKFYGMMEHVPDAGPQQRRMLRGDLIRYQDWTGNYYLLRGVRVDFRNSGPALHDALYLLRHGSGHGYAERCDCRTL